MINDEYQPRVSSRSLLLGTCAEISDSSGLSTFWVRVGAVVALCIWFKLTLLAYCGLAIYKRIRR